MMLGWVVSCDNYALGHAQQHGVPDALTPSAADILLKRGLKRASDASEDDAFLLTRDARQRHTSLYGYHHEFHMACIRNIR